MTVSASLNKSMAPVIIMAGGTGGHIFPALAVAKALQEKSCPVTWIGTENSMEARLVPQHNVPIRYINIKALRGKGLKAKLLLPFRLLHATLQAVSILRELKPAAVLGMGGFVTGPGGIAAWLLRKPLLIHEQNAISGMTNRYLARIAAHVFEAFPNSFPASINAKKDIQCVGNPVRAEIVQLHENTRSEFNGRRAFNLLIVGGSLGALVLNETVPVAIAQLIAEKKLSDSDISIRHQTGERTFADAQNAYREVGLDAEVITFIDDMASAYTWADVIICRAGALTVSEVSAAGVPAIFVPFPYAVDDHQRKNAEVLATAGAADVIVQNDLSPKRLGDALYQLISTPERLGEMSKASKTLAKLEASSIIAEQCLTYVEAAA